MKKRLLFILCLLLGICTLGFSACGGHEHKYTDVVTPPTCTEDGYTTHTCKCGDAKIDTYVNSFGGHSFTNYVEDYATCTQMGNKTAVCDRGGCSETDIIEIPVIDHNFVNGSCSKCNASDGLDYELNCFAQGYIVTGIGSFAGANLVIPKYYNKLPVVEIGLSAFKGCSSLTSIEIPNSVTSIGDYAFEDCDLLTSIEIPNSVTSIGYEAFYNCSSLTSITFNGTMEEWDDIETGYYWNDLVPATYVQCSDGKVTIS